MNWMEGFRDDLGAMVLSAAYVLVVIGVSELARRRGISRQITRKIVHVGIGLWVVPTFLLFEHRFWAVVPPLAFVLVNAASLRFGLIRSVEGEERNVGTVLYPISVALALGLFWNPPWPVVGSAAILVMALGDAAASLVGRSIGRRNYTVAGHTRTLEGSAAMFVFSVAAGLLAFGAFGAPVGAGVVAAVVLAAAVATALEAVSLYGFDNLLVPGSVALVFVLTRGGLWG